MMRRRSIKRVTIDAVAFWSRILWAAGGVGFFCLGLAAAMVLGFAGSVVFGAAFLVIALFDSRRVARPLIYKITPQEIPRFQDCHLTDDGVTLAPIDGRGERDQPACSRRAGSHQARSHWAGV